MKVPVPKPQAVAVPVPQPISRSSNNDYVYFASGDGYEYYDDDYYNDDLGSKFFVTLKILASKLYAKIATKQLCLCLGFKKQ